MSDEIKNEIENVESPKADISPEDIVKSIFGNGPKTNEEKKDEKAKAPINIFSKPIPVTQDEGARMRRKKMALVEGLLFGAFLTSIVAIFAFSGIEAKLDPEAAVNTPSFFYFFLVFVVFSVLMTIGDYYLTERRVNNYNAKMAGINVDIGDEIERALKSQEEEGITAEDAAAQNSANGKEKTFIEVKCVYGADSLTDKGFEAFIGEQRVGRAQCCKGLILDSNGFETIVLRATELFAGEGEFKNGVLMALVDEMKKEAANNTLAAVAIPKSVFGDNILNVADGSKYNITFEEELKVQEAYPGALMGISGALK